MIRRNTIQKEIIFKAVRQIKGHVSADEVKEFLAEEYPSISRGTVYRNLNILSEEGQIKKIKNSDGADVFDLSLHDHYHARCRVCGCISDVDMELVPNLIENINDRHGFEFSGYDIFFEGCCQKCLNKKEA